MRGVLTRASPTNNFIINWPIFLKVMEDRAMGYDCADVLFEPQPCLVGKTIPPLIVDLINCNLSLENVLLL